MNNENSPNMSSYQDLAGKVAGLGRYGDSTLMHVNPLEVAALDSMAPGSITTNPDTGLPEAFAWFIPLLMGAAAGGVAGGVSAKQRDIPLWKGILAGAGLGAATGALTGGISAAMSPAASGVGAAAPSVVGEAAGNLALGTSFGTTAAPVATQLAPAAEIFAGGAGAAGMPTTLGAGAVGPVGLGPEFMAGAGGAVQPGGTAAVAPVAAPVAQESSMMGGIAEAFTDPVLSGEQGFFEGVGAYAQEPIQPIAAMMAAEQFAPRGNAESPWAMFGDGGFESAGDASWQDDEERHQTGDTPSWGKY